MHNQNPLLEGITDLREPDQAVRCVERIYGAMRGAVAEGHDVSPHSAVLVLRNPETGEPLEVPGLLAVAPVMPPRGIAPPDPLAYFRDQVRKIAADLDAVGVVSVSPQVFHGAAPRTEIVLALEHKRAGRRYWRASVEVERHREAAATTITPGVKRTLGPLVERETHGMHPGVWFERMLPASYQS